MNSKLLELGAKVDSQAALAYLEAKGWQKVASPRADEAICHLSDESEAEAIVPLDPSLVDYGRAMVNVAREVASVEGRPPESVLRDLLRPRHDVVRFALEGPITQAGTIGLLDGAKLVGGAKKALLASACSVKKPRIYHPRLDLAEAEAFVRSCKLGQTEVGSFVLTVEAPLDARARPALGKEPLGRKAVAHLMRATAFLVEAIRQWGRDATGAAAFQTVFELEPDLSANLCEALVEMMPSDESADLRLRTSWSPLLAPPADMPSMVVIDRSMYEAIESVGNELRPKHGAQSEQFVGRVVELSGGPDVSGALEGEVVLQAQHDDELLRVRVALGPEEYRHAVQAHLAQQFVSVRGVLRRGRRVHQLDNPGAFTIVDDGQPGPEGASRSRHGREVP
ncbi:MAG TPA: hypothetical protein VFS43_34695 [Polyangiaceae bacterium]|nr:hypothetical protein [Polyangiaceae bacterium]